RTVTVVEQPAAQPLVSETVTTTSCGPTLKLAAKSTRAVVGGPPAATTLVWRAIPSTVQTTTNALPLASATLTDTVATAPVGGAQFTVIGASGQVIVGPLARTVTVVEQVAVQPFVSETVTTTSCGPTPKFAKNPRARSSAV